MTALTVLLLAVPARAGQTTISEGCESVSVTQTSDDGSSVNQSNRARVDGDSCVIQQSNHSGGGDVSQSIRQSQTSDEDGAIRRVRHGDSDDGARTDDSSDEDSFGTTVRSTDTPRGGIETGAGGTLHPKLARSVDEADKPATLVLTLGAMLAASLVAAGLLGLHRTRRR